MKSHRGFTLLEMLVATVIMAVAVGAALQSLTASMRNASRLTSYDRSAMLARRKMDELLTERRLPRFTVLEGSYDANAGWRATVTPFEIPPNPGPGASIMDRIALEVWSRERDQERTFTLEAYRRSTITAEEIEAGVLLPR